MFIRWQNGSGEAGGDCVAWHDRELTSMIAMALSASRVKVDDKRGEK